MYGLENSPYVCSYFVLKKEGKMDTTENQLSRYKDLLRVRAEKSQTKITFLKEKLEAAKLDLDQTLSVYSYVEKDTRKLGRRKNH